MGSGFLLDVSKKLSSNVGLLDGLVDKAFGTDSRNRKPSPEAPRRESNIGSCVLSTTIGSELESDLSFETARGKVLHEPSHSPLHKTIRSLSQIAKTLCSLSTGSSSSTIMGHDHTSDRQAHCQQSHKEKPTETEQSPFGHTIQVVTIGNGKLMDNLHSNVENEYDFESIPISGEGGCMGSFLDASPGCAPEHQCYFLHNLHQRNSVTSGQAGRSNCQIPSTQVFSMRICKQVRVPSYIAKSSKKGGTGSDAGTRSRFKWKSQGLGSHHQTFGADRSFMRNLISICGRDKKARPIVVVNANAVPPVASLHSIALEHIRSKLEPIAEAGDFDLVFFMSPDLEMDDKHELLLAWWCMKVFKKLSLGCRKSIQRIVFIHPTFYTRLLCSILRAFASNRVRRRIHEVNRLEDLEKACGGDISTDMLHLGRSV